MKPEERRKLAKQCHELWLKKSFKMWGGYCECCKAPISTFHHFILVSRCNNLRYDLLNAVPICDANANHCHYKIHFTKDTLEHRRLEDLIINKRGKKWLSYITKESKKRVKINKLWYEEWIRKLK